MRSPGRALVLLVLACAGGLLLACSDPCAYAAPVGPTPDPTPCTADAGPCPLSLYCVTDAGPSFCAPQKQGGARCTTGRECGYGRCLPDGTCAAPSCG